MPLIEMRAVSRSYEVGDTTVTALDDVSLAVEEGEFIVVLGPSGSGKSTLLNVIGALDSPTAGKIVIDGRDVTTAPRKELFRFRRHEVSFIFQTFNLFPALTALENVEFGADVAGRTRPRDRRRDPRSCRTRQPLDHFPHELSGGEQQRVAIARALASANPIVLADEPTGELDSGPASRSSSYCTSRTHTEGTAVLVVSHNREISRVADRVIELSSGRLIATGRPPVDGPNRDLRW